MHLILLMFLLVMIAVVSAGVLRRRRELRRAERAKALRYERWKARRDSIPNMSSNLYGSTGATQTTPVSRISQNQSPIHCRKECRARRMAGFSADLSLRLSSSCDPSVGFQRR
jgi:hypothetical protein